jgi:two-component system alkaline phosphatase synthesis response regulator PhoP
MLTARSDSMDKVIGLEVGADDYLTKPFEPAELVARVRAHLRRATEYQPEVAAVAETTSVGDLVIDHQSRTARIGGDAIELTNKEFELLALLARNAGRVLTREALFESVWGYELDFNSNSLDVYMYRLRKKIEPDPDHPRYLHTLKGYGYRLGDG